MLGSGSDAAVPIVASTAPFTVAVGRSDPLPRLDAAECAHLRDRINERIRSLARARASAISKRKVG